MSVDLARIHDYSPYFPHFWQYRWLVAQTESVQFNRTTVKLGKPRTIPQKNSCYRSQDNYVTRMHSSRMRTGRSLTVCCSLLPGGGVPGPGGCLVWGSAWSRGVPSPRGEGGLPAGGGGCLPGMGGCLVPGGSPCQGVPGLGGGGVLPAQGGWGSAWSWGGSPCLGGAARRPPC